MMTEIARALAARLAELLHREHEAMAEFLLHLAEFDRVQGWRALGYAGLFPFLERELGLSKSGAFFRTKAAQLIQEYPEVLEPLRDGRLCLSTMAEVAKVLRPENRETVLPRFFHRSKQQAKAVAAELAPVPDPPVRAIVTPLGRTAVEERPGSLAPETPSQTVLPGEPTQSTCLPLAALAPAALPLSGTESAPPRSGAQPMTGELSRLHVTVSRPFLDKLEAARVALSHSAPSAPIEQVLEVGLDLILARDSRKKALVARPRPAKDPGLLRFDSRYIPAELRREVWGRDQGRCQWPMENGGICGSTYRPELDHIDGFQPGKPITAKDLRVCCAPHNQEHARQVYGDAYMAQFRRRGRVGRGDPGQRRTRRRGPFQPPASPGQPGATTHVLGRGPRVDARPRRS